MMSLNQLFHIHLREFLAALINLKEIIEMGKKGEKQLLKILIELLKDI